MNKEQALIILKNLHKDAIFSVKTALEILIPEIKEESKNERIRKRIIETINLYYGEPLEEEAKEMIAWLEEQVEQREQLINKACDVLINCIEDYMLRRIEVWNEECKKQTLENIRKKLEE